VIDPKNNIRSQATHSGQPESLDSAVRARAYEIYELGGRIDGRAEQDWYQAEADLQSIKQA
jgi:Protein of unknown function (DUF2934)